MPGGHLGEEATKWAGEQASAQESRVIHRSRVVVLCDDCLAVVDDGHDVAQVVADLKGSFADELFFGGWGWYLHTQQIQFRLKDTYSVAAVQVLCWPIEVCSIFFIDG